MRDLISKIAVILTLVFLTSCTKYTGFVGNPVSRSVTWFSFVAGDNIKSACVAGGSDHFRFVYNGVYERHIRVYELKVENGAVAYSARARNESGNLGRFSFSNPLGPWELQKFERRLTEAQALRIINSFSEDVATAPNSAGQQLSSNGFYWIVAACRGGNFRISAFNQDTVGLNALAFAAALLSYDETGVAIQNVEPVEGFNIRTFFIKINDAADGTVG